MKKIVIISVLLNILVFLGVAGYARAEINRVTLRVDGLACPFCAYGLEKKIARIKGVSSYDVDMRQGEVFIGFKENVRIEPKIIKKAVKEAGFTLRGIKLTVAGRLSNWEDPVLGRNNLILTASGSNQIFLLMEKEKISKGSPDLDRLRAVSGDTGGPVVISGKIYEHKTEELADKLPPGIIVDSFELK